MNDQRKPSRLNWITPLRVTTERPLFNYVVSVCFFLSVHKIDIFIQRCTHQRRQSCHQMGHSNDPSVKMNFFVWGCWNCQWICLYTIYLSLISWTVFSGLTSCFLICRVSHHPPFLQPSSLLCCLHLHRSRFTVSLCTSPSSIIFLDILMLCPLWIVYSVRVLQEITSMRIFWCTRQSGMKPD